MSLAAVGIARIFVNANGAKDGPGAMGSCGAILPNPPQNPRILVSNDRCPHLSIRIRSGLSQLFAVCVLLTAGCGTSRWANDPQLTTPAGQSHNVVETAEFLEHGQPSDTESPEFCQWAQEHLESGDILFSMSDARAFFGLFPFARVMIRMTDSRFSHTAMVSREDGDIYVYDMAPGGPRRVILADYMARNGKHAFAVKRVRHEHRDAVAPAVLYCQRAYQKQCPFDRVFSQDDDCLYCTEMTQKAYSEGGVKLSRPVRLDHFPRYRDFPKVTWLGRLLTKIRPEQGIILPGNDSMGIWASPELELVYDNGRPGYAAEPPTTSYSQQVSAKAPPYRIVSASERSQVR